MGDVGDGVVDLGVGEGPARPVGEARGFVERDLADALGQFAIGDLVAKAADHGRDLGVEQRFGNDLGEVPDDFDILPRGVKDLHDIFIGHQLEEGLEVETFGQGVDRRRAIVAGDLDHADLRPKRRLTEKFRIDGDKGILGESLA